MLLSAPRAWSLTETRHVRWQRGGHGRLSSSFRLVVAAISLRRWHNQNAQTNRSVDESFVWPILWFALGWISLVIALDSPLHEIGEQLFWVHMTQHEILMLISAPLLILGRPMIAFLWALPRAWRETAAEPWAFADPEEELGIGFGPILGMVGIRIGIVDLAYSVSLRSNTAQ